MFVRKIFVVAILSLGLVWGQYRLFSAEIATASVEAEQPATQIESQMPSVLPPLGVTAQAVISTVVISATRDDFINSASPDNNAGAQTHLAAGRVDSNGGNGIRRGLIGFDLVGQIPTGSTVMSVTFNLNVTRQPSFGAVDSNFRLYRLITDWGEGAKTGNSGQAATDGEVTWNAARHNVSDWTANGGDFVNTVSASTAVSGVGSYSWASTPELVADVQGWLDNPATSFGWLLRSDNEVDAKTARLFGSKEGNNPATITINFMAPQLPQPDLQLSKTASTALASPGQVMTYTIIVVNDGTAAATNVMLVDNLPAGTELAGDFIVDRTSNGSGVGTGNIGNLPILFANALIGAGERITVTVPVTVSSMSSTMLNGMLITNTATITSDQNTVAITASATTTIAEQMLLFLPVVARP